MPKTSDPSAFRRRASAGLRTIRNFQRAQVFVVLGCLACADRIDSRSSQIGAGAATSASVEVHDRESIFEPTGSVITPSFQDSVPLVRLSGVEWLEDGRILIADVSAANAKLYSSSGQLILVIGGRGSGPGEFTQPRYPAVDRLGRIIVGEGNGLVSYFSAQGEFLRRVVLGKGSGISSLSVRDNGDLLATGWPAEAGALVLYDSLGMEKQRFVPFEFPPVVDQPRNPLWGSALQFWHILRGDTALVASTLSDSLWSVSLTTGEVSATRLVFAEYEKPALPTEPSSQGPRDQFAWTRKFSTTVAMVGGHTSSTFGMSFVVGILHYGDPSVFVFRAPTGEWLGARNSLPVLAMRNDRILTLLDPSGEDVTLGIFKMRSR